MKVERFFHIRGFYPYGGATVRVTGDTDHPGQVEVQHAVCSKKDMYCKRTGRELALSRTPRVIPLRSLPKEIADITRKAEQINHGYLQTRDYNFALRYFLPRELA